MHDIEPYFKWREEYIASEDDRSPFHGREYDEFTFSQKIYNYFIHPQWDAFGSNTLYLKILFVDYEEQFAIIELLGEWNDCLHNDVNYLKRDVVDPLINEGINKFVLLTENVLNFHGGDDCYYEEWWDDIKEENGWIAMVNTLDHVKDEMLESQLQYFAHFGNYLNNIKWHSLRPYAVFKMVEHILANKVKQLV